MLGEREGRQWDRRNERGGEGRGKKEGEEREKGEEGRGGEKFVCLGWSKPHLVYTHQIRWNRVVVAL